MIVKIYANYGVLAHEKETVYTTAPHEYATVSEPVTVTIPESVTPRENEAGEIIVTLDGTAYLLCEVLTNAGDKPVIRWYDGAKYKTISLA
jgi:hypothetical protein